MLNIETKTQTIYYEDSVGRINKFYYTGNERLNLSKASNVLLENNVNMSNVIRVITERVFLKLDRKDFHKFIASSERYYKKQ